MKKHWPEVKIPEGFNDAESYLRHLVYQGAKEKFVDDNDSNSENLREERIKHIEHELESLKGYEPYLIMSYELVNFCRAKGIVVSPGYGDAINSIVNYCLGITTTEPDSFYTFECFFLRGTDLYPKLYIQVDETRKDEIFEYLKSTYGEHQVLRAGVGHRKGHERVPVYAVHACGVCIFDRPYYDIIETIDIIDKDSGKRTTVPKLTIQELESLGYININILDMNCLTPTSQTLQLIKQNKGEDVDFDHIPDDDPATMEFLASENEDIDKIWDCKGIAKDFASVKPTYMLELCAINSLWTINLNDYIDYYIYLVQEDKCNNRFEIFEELFFEMSRGLILYQEQILAILYIMSGLSIAECERIRRMMSTTDNLSGKKKFLDGVKVSGGYTIEEAERIWNYFMEIHKKTVSMAHYLSLTVLWYRISWLRVHYPEEFSQCYLKGLKD